MDCSELDSTEKSKPSQLLRAINQIYEEGREESTHSETNAASVEKTMNLLKEKAETGDSQATFLLGQLHYVQGCYTEAELIFNRIKDKDPQALYQLAVIYYDGLGTKEDLGRAVEYMGRVAFWDSSEAGSVRYAALYNLGQAYLEGFGVQASSSEAERLWLLAADDGNPNASVKAQSALGMFYSRPESLDLRKAFFWHSQACGNGSLESQAALGLMYLYGHGVQRDSDSALFCLKEAAERGSVYAQGHLTACYYRRQLYSRAAAPARVCEYKDTAAIAQQTDCLEEYVRKGIAIGMFYYARCLHLGRGVPQNRDKAKHYCTQAVRIDPLICKELQIDAAHGKI